MRKIKSAGDLLRPLMPCVCVLSFVVSVIALCFSIPKTDGLGFDYSGLLVGVLSFIVTLLIGWNIYTVIDIGKTRSEIANIANGASKDIQKGLALTEQSFWMCYNYLLTHDDPAGLEYRFLYHGIASVYHLSCAGELNTCNAVVDALLETLVRPQSISMSAFRKGELLKLLTKVQRTEAMPHFVFLVERVAKITVDMKSIDNGLRNQ